MLSPTTLTIIRDLSGFFGVFLGTMVIVAILAPLGSLLGLDRGWGGK